MLAVNTTVVAVVGPGDGVALDRVRAANVRVVQPDADAPALERAVKAWDEARRTSQPYAVHDADPLAWVAGAWTRLFDGEGAAGELEVATAETLARWRARSLDLPDYYLVVDPESLPATRRHWFMGVLAGAAPARVVPAPPDTAIVDCLDSLPSGPWWPSLDRIVARLDHVVPDQAGAIKAPPDQPTGVIRPA